MSPPNTLVVGRVVTLDSRHPVQDAVLLDTEGTVIAFGAAARVQAHGRVQTLEEHQAVTPRLIDHHLHLRASAAAKLSIDVSTPSCPSVTELLERLRGATGTGWLRAWGFDEALIPERRFPTLDELDAVARPLLIHHRTGHLVQCNRAALRALGLTDDRAGLLREVPKGAVPQAPADDMAAALRVLAAELVTDGVGAVTDATHSNTPADLEGLAVMASAGVAVTAMLGAQHLTRELTYGAIVATADGPVRVGHAKVMPSEPVSAAAVREAVEHAVAHGFPAAVHAVDVDGVEAARRAFETYPPPPGTAHRIEHAGLVLPEQVDAIAVLGIEVVTQPAFLHHRWTKYAAELTPVEHQWLYRVGSLARAGIRVRLSSDAPVVPPRMSEAVAGAMRRPSLVGAPAAAMQARASEEVGLVDAVEMCAVGPLRVGDRAAIVSLGAI